MAKKRFSGPTPIIGSSRYTPPSRPPTPRRALSPFMSMPELIAVEFALANFVEFTPWPPTTPDNDEQRDQMLAYIESALAKVRGNLRAMDEKMQGIAADHVRRESDATE